MCAVVAALEQQFREAEIPFPSGVESGAARPTDNSAWEVYYNLISGVTEISRGHQ